METGNKEIQWTGWSISLYSTEHSASWEFSIHMCGSSKCDVVHLTVSCSESDLEESDTAV